MHLGHGVLSYQEAQLISAATLQVADSASADGTKEKEQDRDADKDKAEERHVEQEKESGREQEKEKPKRVYKTDEGLLVACRYFDRTGVMVPPCKPFRKDTERFAGWKYVKHLPLQLHTRLPCAQKHVVKY
jgi:hypothetical protein